MRPSRVGVVLALGCLSGLGPQPFSRAAPFGERIEAPARDERAVALSRPAGDSLTGALEGRGRGRPLPEPSLVLEVPSSPRVTPRSRADSTIPAPADRGIVPPAVGPISPRAPPAIPPA